MPTTTHIVDLRKEFAAGNRSIFSRLLQRKIEENLAKKKQIILFLNKRGFSSSLTCRECGFTMKCRSCDISMAYHKGGGPKDLFMLCHYCGSREKVPPICPNCTSVYIRFFGIGTQKITEIAEDTFKNAKIARADRDSTAQKAGFERIYQDFKSGQTDILIGTQIIAKGLDIENVGLVGVILADIGLQIPDFRSSERTFQLLTQVAGRTGRLGSQGEVIIQTYVPEQPAIRFAAQADYAGFYAQEIEERKNFGYPPFGKLIKLMYVHEKEERVRHEAEHLYNEITWLLEHKEELKEADIEVRRAPALVYKQHNKYHYHILLKGPDPDLLFKFVTPKSGWRIDVDPVNTT